MIRTFKLFGRIYKEHEIRFYINHRQTQYGCDCSRWVRYRRNESGKTERGIWHYSNVGSRYEFSYSTFRKQSSSVRSIRHMDISHQEKNISSPSLTDRQNEMVWRTWKEHWWSAESRMGCWCCMAGWKNVPASVCDQNESGITVQQRTGSIRQTG